MEESSKLEKEKLWIKEYDDWLVEDPPCRELWCNLCQKSIKRKKQNVDLHASSTKHIRKMRELNETLQNMKEDPSGSMEVEDSEYLHSVPSSEHEQLDYTTCESFKPEHGFSFSDSKENLCLIKDEVESYEYMCYNEQSNEIDEFARSIAAQMKMLPEDQVISLFYEIQNLITKKRLQAFEHRQKKIPSQDPSIVISAFDINDDVSS